MMVESMIHEGQEPELQEIFLTGHWFPDSGLQVKSLIPKLQERELHGIGYYPYSVAPTFPVYDGEERN